MVLAKIQTQASKAIIAKEANMGSFDALKEKISEKTAENFAGAITMGKIRLKCWNFPEKICEQVRQ